MNNEKLSEQKKGDKLEVPGLIGIIIPGMQTLNNNLANKLGDNNLSSDIFNAFTNLRNAINQLIEKDKKRADELNK